MLTSASPPWYTPQRTENKWSNGNLYTNVHGAIFIIAEWQNQPKNASTNTWIEMSGHIHTMQYVSVTF